MIKIAATMKDVAEYAGLSIATVSKYINGIKVKEENKKRIDEAIKALDFRVNEIARGLKTKNNNGRRAHPKSRKYFSTTIVSKVESILLKYGYSTIICDYRQNRELENEKFDFLINKQVDGIILVPYGINESKIIEALKEDIPVILIDRSIRESIVT